MLLPWCHQLDLLAKCPEDNILTAYPLVTRRLFIQHVSQLHSARPDPGEESFLLSAIEEEPEEGEEQEQEQGIKEGPGTAIERTPNVKSQSSALASLLLGTRAHRLWTLQVLGQAFCLPIHQVMDMELIRVCCRLYGQWLIQWQLGDQDPTQAFLQMMLRQMSCVFKTRTSRHIHLHHQPSDISSHHADTHSVLGASNQHHHHSGAQPAQSQSLTNSVEPDTTESTNIMTKTVTIPGQVEACQLVLGIWINVAQKRPHSDPLSIGTWAVLLKLLLGCCDYVLATDYSKPAHASLSSHGSSSENGGGGGLEDGALMSWTRSTTKSGASHQPTAHQEGGSLSVHSSLQHISDAFAPFDKYPKRHYDISGPLASLLMAALFECWFRSQTMDDYLWRQMVRLWPRWSGKMQVMMHWITMVSGLSEAILNQLFCEKEPDVSRPVSVKLNLTSEPLVYELGQDFLHVSWHRIFKLIPDPKYLPPAVFTVAVHGIGNILQIFLAFPGKTRSELQKPLFQYHIYRDMHAHHEQLQKNQKLGFRPDGLTVYHLFRDFLIQSATIDAPDATYESIKGYLAGKAESIALLMQLFSMYKSWDRGELEMLFRVLALVLRQISGHAQMRSLVGLSIISNWKSFALELGEETDWFVFETDSVGLLGVSADITALAVDLIQSSTAAEHDFILLDCLTYAVPFVCCSVLESCHNLLERVTQAIYKIMDRTTNSVADWQCFSLLVYLLRYYHSSGDITACHGIVLLWSSRVSSWFEISKNRRRWLQKADAALWFNTEIQRIVCSHELILEFGKSILNLVSWEDIPAYLALKISRSLRFFTACVVESTEDSDILQLWISVLQKFASGLFLAQTIEPVDALSVESNSHSFMDDMTEDTSKTEEIEKSRKLVKNDSKSAKHSESRIQDKMIKLLQKRSASSGEPQPQSSSKQSSVPPQLQSVVDATRRSKNQQIFFGAVMESLSRLVIGLRPSCMKRIGTKYAGNYDSLAKHFFIDTEQRIISVYPAEVFGASYLGCHTLVLVSRSVNGVSTWNVRIEYGDSLLDFWGNKRPLSVNVATPTGTISPPMITAPMISPGESHTGTDLFRFAELIDVPTPQPMDLLTSDESRSFWNQDSIPSLANFDAVEGVSTDLDSTNHVQPVYFPPNLPPKAANEFAFTRLFLQQNGILSNEIVYPLQNSQELSQSLRELDLAFSNLESISIAVLFLENITEDQRLLFCGYTEAESTQFSLFYGPKLLSKEFCDFINMLSLPLNAREDKTFHHAFSGTYKEIQNLKVDNFSVQIQDIPYWCDDITEMVFHCPYLLSMVSDSGSPIMENHSEMCDMRSKICRRLIRSDLIHIVWIQKPEHQMDFVAASQRLLGEIHQQNTVTLPLCFVFVYPIKSKGLYKVHWEPINTAVNLTAANDLIHSIHHLPFLLRDLSISLHRQLTMSMKPIDRQSFMLPYQFTNNAHWDRRDKIVRIGRQFSKPLHLSAFMANVLSNKYVNSSSQSGLH